MRMLRLIWRPVGMVLLLYVLLFLGDGNGSYVDVVAASFVSLLYISTVLYKPKVRELSRLHLYAWSALLIYLLIRIPFSIDIGSSVRWWIRYGEAFLMYVCWYSYSDDHERSVAPLILTVFGIAAGLASVVLSLVPDLRGSIPAMNLLWSTAGHNHIADILLLTLLPTLMYISRFRKISYVGITVMLLSFVFAMARVAFVVASFSVSAFIAFQRRMFGTTGRMFTLALVTGCLAVLLLVPEIRPAWHPFNTLSFRKTSLSQERRTEYWRQAGVAFLDRPLFGWGLGTFYLLSNRYQKFPANSSWYAHSYVLEAAAENGMVGVMLLGFVFTLTYGYPVIRLISKRHIDWLALSPLPLLIYALTDFSLDYLVVWLLIWFTVGIASPYEI